MATLSHEAFRLAIEKFGGCDEYFTEMINAPSLLNQGPFEKFYLLAGPSPEKIVWQITGNKEESISKACAYVAKLGGIGVDINMGCSAPQIYKTGAGIAWMLKPVEETESLIRLVRKSLDEVEKETGKHMRLSVKCRLGDDNFTDSQFFSFSDMLVENGVELITLHARTIKEKYRTLPKYEYVEKLALRYKDKDIPIFINGDVKDYKSLCYALQKAPHSSGVMIARAAAQKPWIFAELSKDIDNKSDEKTKRVDCKQLALDFIDDVVRYQPEEFHKTRIQRFFSYYCMNFSFGHYFQTQILNYHSVEETKEKIMEYFLKEPEDQYISY